MGSGINQHLLNTSEAEDIECLPGIECKGNETGNAIEYVGGDQETGDKIQDGDDDTVDGNELETAESERQHG